MPGDAKQGLGLCSAWGSCRGQTLAMLYEGKTQTFLGGRYKVHGWQQPTLHTPATHLHSRDNESRSWISERMSLCSDCLPDPNPSSWEAAPELLTVSGIAGRGAGGCSWLAGNSCVRRLCTRLASAVTQALLTRTDDSSVKDCRALRLPLDLWQCTLSSYRGHHLFQYCALEKGLQRPATSVGVQILLRLYETVALSKQPSLLKQILFWAT